jgi:hypothetical protein
MSVETKNQIKEQIKKLLGAKEEAKDFPFKFELDHSDENASALQDAVRELHSETTLYHWSFNINSREISVTIDIALPTE